MSDFSNQNDKQTSPGDFISATADKLQPPESEFGFLFDKHRTSPENRQKEYTEVGNFIRH